MLPLCIALISAALALATPLSAAEAVFPPGSRVGLAPLKDMEPSKRFTGFENLSKGAAITFIEMPREAYSSLARELTAENLKTQGFMLKNRETLTIGGTEAVLLSGEQEGLPLRKWMLVAADPSTTALVVAQALRQGEAGSYTDEEIRGALTSVAFRAPLTIEDQMTALPFRLGALAGFRPVRTMAGNALLLTDGPRDTIAAAEQPMLIVAKSLDAGPGREQRDAFARGALAGNDMVRDLVPERAQSFRQGGADWHEIVARGQHAGSGDPVVVMQTIRFAPDSYMRVLGVARADTRDAMLPRFRAVADGLTVKDERP
jgi:hypothetical protein